ncbi:hypothetical protein O6H91_16G003500 [Diphasiastrum complanatum]|uniref:Uncharacterized protein n=1 Tax=Diphasiastrum complanatum TaxID=34168 RepID=A0ACC2B9C4_DIPCM|nr:hypothetical protein O6H91_16G003500 [Diphasiastrum complanatum]
MLYCRPDIQDELRQVKNNEVVQNVDMSLLHIGVAKGLSKLVVSKSYDIGNFQKYVHYPRTFGTRIKPNYNPRFITRSSCCCMLDDDHEHEQANTCKEDNRDSQN